MVYNFIIDELSNDIIIPESTESLDILQELGFLNPSKDIPYSII
ncbi:uncharacterized protein METZ01_LOCUS320179, partial [marine metagenome]